MPLLSQMPSRFALAFEKKIRLHGLTSNLSNFNPDPDFRRPMVTRRRKKAAMSAIANTEMARPAPSKPASAGEIVSRDMEDLVAHCSSAAHPLSWELLHFLHQVGRSSSATF